VIINIKSITKRKTRAAFVVDRFMRMVGLPGKSFVPMIVGFGCNVPAIMATRTLESQRDRILTNIMNPFMSCGARLPVYALFAAAFFPVGGQNLVFALYVFGIMVAVCTIGTITFPAFTRKVFNRSQVRIAILCTVGK
jgi:ferrous iron transport protein B